MRLLHLAFGNWFSRAYLLLVAAVAVVVTFSSTIFGPNDDGLIAVWLFLVTAPISLLVTLGADSLGALGDDKPAGMALVIAGFVLAALVNATMIGLLVSLARRHRRSIPSAPVPRP